MTKCHVSHVLTLNILLFRNIPKAFSTLIWEKYLQFRRSLDVYYNDENFLLVDKNGMWILIAKDMKRQPNGQPIYEGILTLICISIILFTSH